MGKLTAKQILEVCERYTAGEFMPALGKIYGVTTQAIWSLLHNRNIPRHSRRIHSLDQSVFDVITEESAYWLGFLIADGCVTHQKRNNPYLTMALQTKDLDHLKAFKRFMGSSHKLYRHTQREAFIFNVSIDTLVPVLAKYGIVPRKSHIAQASSELASNRHFWRGVVDGDGSVGIFTKRNQPFLHLAGAKPLMSQFAAFVLTVVPAYRGSVRPARSIFVVALSGSTAYHVGRHLYQNCDTCLPRKQSRVDAWPTYPLSV